VGLRERADLLGGSVESGPLPEGGFELRLTIPMI
jgi:signal transduction histidine kinase